MGRRAAAAPSRRAEAVARDDDTLLPEILLSTPTRGAAPRGAPARIGRIPTLTILHHPSLARVGDRAWLSELAGGAPTALSRSEPPFRAPDGKARPLGDPFLSRRPITMEPSGGGILFSRGQVTSRIRLNGADVPSAFSISEQELDNGAVLELGERVVLLLHRRGPAGPRGPDYDIIGESEAISRLREEIRNVADLDVPVLVRGESGVGKELVARAIHATSARNQRRLISLNMAAVPPSTAAAELFGHRKGAFTGATADRDGYFQRAHGGTLFLDEIGETPPEVQSMLLRVLETGEVQPVGSGATRRVDVRLMAATDADLARAVSIGAFKAPLLHRLSGFRIHVCALKDRREDIGRLLAHFLSIEMAAIGEAHRLDAGPDDPMWLPAELAGELARYHWPGNVRELRNVVRQLVIGCRRLAQVDLRSLEGVLDTPAPDEAISSPDASPTSGIVAPECYARQPWKSYRRTSGA